MSTESEKCRKRVTHVEFPDLHLWSMHCGRQWVMSIWKKFSTDVSLCWSYPFQVRGRFRQATRVALETLHNGVLGHDTLMEGDQRLEIVHLAACSGDLVATPRWARTSCVEGLTSSGLRGAPVLCLKVWRRPTLGRIPSNAAAAACQKIKLGEISRARQCLTGASLAPWTEAMFQFLQARRPQVVARELPEAVQTFEPESLVTVDRKIFSKCLKSAPRGASPRPGGCTYEHLKTLLDDTDTMELLFEAITSLARANVPVEIAEVLVGARLTPLTKPDGGVRGIATGSSLRRLVAISRLKRSVPFQYALSTRAGTDCVGHLRASTDRDPTSTVLSFDGIGANDHVLRSAMLGRLLQMPAARAILPFVRSSYTWVDCEGTAHCHASRRRRARRSAHAAALLHWHSRCA